MTLRQRIAAEHRYHKFMGRHPGVNLDDADAPYARMKAELFESVQQEVAARRHRVVERYISRASLERDAHYKRRKSK